MPRAIDVDVDRFWRDGFLLIRGVFTAEECARMREGIHRSRALTGPEDEDRYRFGCILSNPHMPEIVLDERIVSTARSLLGGAPVYFGDSSYSTEVPLGVHYHKDNAGRADPSHPDWQGRYTVLRFGIYLNHHSREIGGVRLRQGSHHGVSTTFGKDSPLRTGPGDLVVWTMTATHSGGVRMWPVVRWPASARAEPLFVAYQHLRSFLNHRGILRWKRVHMVSRDVIWIAYGLDDEHLRTYIEFSKTRNYMQHIWRNAEYGPEVYERARSVGVKIINGKTDLGTGGDEAAA